MVILKGYSISETLYRSGTTLVYRGVRTSDGAPVVCKLLSMEYPSAQDLSSFRREYEITAKLRGQGTVKVHALEEVGNSLAMVMEDFGGEPLTQLTGAGFEERLHIATQIADALARIHRWNIIHKDINPSNIIGNPKTGVVKIIDFGIATELSREAASPLDVAAMEGTLPYISPEQTGRMNRPLDYRTDLYSLGITLWELFTGQLPFSSDDPLELVYAHIARLPPSPHQVRPDVPEAVAAIILKLLAKAPEDRYQSAAGVLADLDRCIRELAERGNIETFMLGEADASDRFSIPNRLYGREGEISVLEETFAEAVDDDARLLLVSGAPGVGKTSLIQEVHKLLPKKKGLLASGKFNQLEASIPYSALLRALRDLLDQLLCASADVVNSCKAAMLNALGGNAGVLIELLPRLGQLLGPQPPPRPLDPVAAHNRLQLVFREFLGAFTGNDHPVVLFLDDLQWSDPPTLDLIKYLLGHGLPGLLLVGAYRDNEVREGHPLSVMLKAFADNPGVGPHRTRKLVIQPLGLEEVNQLVADTLRRDSQDTRPLSGLIHGKTDGNPFFTTQMLMALHTQGAIAYKATENYWDWDFAQVARAELSDNVVAFLVQELRTLPERGKNLLKIAACIGHTFDLKTVVQVHGATDSELGLDLWQAIEKGLIIPLDRNYRLLSLQESQVELSALDVVFRFQHDRLVQAVQSMLSEEEQARIHYAIGREMLKVFRDADLFPLVNHLNVGQRHVAEAGERVELAELNAMAGRKAFAATAFKSAAQYFASAVSLHQEDQWTSRPHERFPLCLQMAESVFLAGDLGRAATLTEPLFDLAHDNLERASVHNLKSRILEFQCDLSGAIDEIRKSLRAFGISLPEAQDEIQRRVGMGLGRLQQSLARMAPEELLQLPEMNDPEKLMAMRLLSQVVPSAIQCNYPLYMIATMMMADLTLAHGITAESCKCIADCGIISSSALGDYENGYRLGKVAFALIEKLNVEWQKPPVCFSFTYVSHMRRHFQEGLDHYEMSYRLGMKVGDLQHATYARAHKIHLMFWVGVNLEECRDETQSTIAFLKESQGFVQLMLANIVSHAIGKLRATPTPEQAQEQAKTDEDIMATVGQMRHVVLIGRFSQYNAFHHFLLGESDQAERWSESADGLLFAMGTDFPVADHFLVQCLLCIDKLKRSAPHDRGALHAKISANLAKLKKFTDNCPDNFAHKYHLVCAELAAVQGEPLEKVVEHYREALAAIRKREFPQMVALINERQGKFWIERNSDTIARAFLREAHYHYQQWGALRKAEAMEHEYHDYFAFKDDMAPAPGKTHRTTRKPRTSGHSLSNAALDITSIVKSTQAISSEIRTEKLLRTLLQTIMENAGAQNGCLMLANESSATLDIVAQRGPTSDAIEIVTSTPYQRSPDLCREIVEYVERTRESVVLDNAAVQGNFSGNPYLQERGVKSVLCLPVIRQSFLKGAVYLENNLTDHAFTTERLNVLTILAAQASISIENARLYEDMEEKVRDRTNLLRQANVKLRELSLIDPLTRLNNRRFFHDHITGVTEGYVRKLNPSPQGIENRNLSPSENVMGVFLVDIDHFKQVNDTWGHTAGDAVLVNISRILKSLVRADDFIVRWGGEEFLVVLNKTDPAYLARFAQRVLQAVRAGSITVDPDTVIHKTCSIGYARIPFCRAAPEFLSLEHTIKLADYAMYQAKQSGRNQAVSISPRDGTAPTEALRACLKALSRHVPSDTSCVELKHLQAED